MLARLRIGTRSGQPSKAAAGARPTSSASATRRVALDRREQRARAAAPRGPRRCRRPARRRRARRASGRWRAGPAAPRSPPSRMARAIAPRVVAGRRRAELEVEGDERRARGDEDGARGRVHARGAEVGRAGRRRIRCGEARGAAAAQLGARAPVGQQRRRGRRAGRARRGRRRARAPRRTAAPRCSARAEDDGRDVEGADVRVQPVVAREVDALDRLARAARRAPACSVPGAAASVNTARLWSGSAWRSSTRAPPAAKAAPMASRTAASRPSETLGTASSSTLRGRSARRRARSCRRSSASRRSRRRRGGSAPTTVPPMPALAPKATWIVPRIFSSSRMLPVSCARVVGADAELGEVGALLAGAREQLVEALALGPGRLRQAPALDGQVRRVALDEADARPASASRPSPLPRPAR